MTMQFNGSLLAHGYELTNYQILVNERNFSQLIYNYRRCIKHQQHDTYGNVQTCTEYNNRSVSHTKEKT